MSEVEGTRRKEREWILLKNEGGEVTRGTSSGLYISLKRDKWGKTGFV